METPFFSVIIPAWNAATTLHETLDSIAEQNDPSPREVIVVDDGSTDRTVQVAQDHSSHPRVIRKVNGGAPSAFNVGIKATQGAVLAFLDADDLWMPDKLALQRAALDSDPSLDAVLGHSETFESPEYPAEAFVSLRYKKGRYPGYLASSLAVRRSAVERLGILFDETLRTGSFIDWYRRAVAAGMKVTMLDEKVHRRRIRPGTLSRRVAGDAPAGMASDFLEIARRAIMAKRGDDDGERGG
ncbi:MAG: glycosyltransferase family 2 protein [Mesorhizobium sp.]|uniref:glycosyltransferase family 2 protein n=1 Tax=Mesorhizobium sp. TaxID=1871066 RepID=UPI000FE83DC0|nr:glycosyltransferase family A protein [Mesorhizobium sp.]RWM08445.1 MAG: glycosyltransferase family 2 protein [Mesorhizobium sp.]